MRRPRLASVAVLLLAVELLAPAVSFASVSPTTVAAPRAGTTPTPLLSVRRDPTWVAATVARQRLVATLSSITSATSAPGTAPGGAQTCVLVTQGGTDLYALAPTAELIPASNLKLVTATAVLDTLGAGSQLTTTVATSSRPVGGTVAGDLYLIGGGDPYLMTAAHDSSFYYPEPVYTSLDRLAASVRAAGVTAVSGSVVGDGSRYDSLVAVPTWAPEYLAEGDVGPLSALEVDDGAPPSAPPPASPAPGSDSAVAAPAPSGPAALVPNLSAAQTFTAQLRAHGVRVAGPAATGRAPAGALALTSASSGPLATEVDQMLRVSDDTAAELFTKELGLRVSGRGTTAAGTAVIRRDITADGLPAAQLVALDGSGLDRGDRATCNLIIRTLEHAGTAGVLSAGLPVAARSGTLKDRMAATAAAGRLHAKTGTLDQVSALSGFVNPAPGASTPGLGAPVYFSVIINGMDDRLAAPLADRIAVAIAGYPEAPPLRAVGPRP